MREGLVPGWMQRPSNTRGTGGKEDRERKREKERDRVREGGEREREREWVRLIVGSRDPGRSSGAGLLWRGGSSREKFSRRRVVARVRGQRRAFRGVRGVGGGSPESVPRVGSRMG